MLLGPIPTIENAIRGVTPPQKLNMSDFEARIKQAILINPDEPMNRSQFIFRSVVDHCNSEKIPMKENIQILSSLDFENLSRSISDAAKQSKMKDKGEIL